MASTSQDTLSHTTTGTTLQNTSLSSVLHDILNHTTVITAQNTSSLTEQDCYLSDSSDGCNILRVLKKAIVSVTIVLQFMTLISMVILGKHKCFSQRIFGHILLVNLIANFSTLFNDGLPESEGSALCVAQGYFIQAFEFGTFMWVCCLTLFLFMKVILSKNLEMYEGWCVAVCWITPCIIACLPLITDSYGPASMPYCWISGRYPGTIWRFAIYWGPVFGGIVVILITFVYMIWKVSRSITQYGGSENASDWDQRRLVKEYLRPLTAYAAAFVLIHLIQFINRVQNSADEPIFGLVAFHIILLTSYGIILCTLFVINNGKKEFTWMKYKMGLKLLFKRPNRNSTDEYEPGTMADTLQAQ